MTDTVLIASALQSSYVRSTAAVAAAYRSDGR